MVGEMLGEIVEEVTRGSFEAIEGTFQLEHVRVGSGTRCVEATKLVDIDLF